jgi:conjugal transfer pilus assembly protein TraV
MNSSFDCPNKAGLNCKSLDQINEMVDNGNIRGRTQLSTEKATEVEVAGNTEFQSYPMIASFIPSQPLRYGETVQRIWIAPFEDNEGNYHQENVMYSIMQSGHWIGQPVKTTHSF